MRPSANIRITTMRDMMPVPRGLSTSPSARGVSPSDYCDLCYLACEFLSGPEKAACYVACDLLC